MPEPRPIRPPERPTRPDRRQELSLNVLLVHRGVTVYQRGCPDARAAMRRLPASIRLRRPRWLRSVRLGADLRHSEPATDLRCKPIRDLLVARHRFDRTGGRIAPERVRAAFALEVAAMLPQA